jgi:hypothetical protein
MKVNKLQSTEILMKALFLDHKYAGLLKELTAQNMNIGQPISAWLNIK